MGGWADHPVAPGFRLRYFAPAPALRQWLSSYYLFETSATVFHDTMRAELPQIRFLGAGYGTYACGTMPAVAMPPASLCGASDRAAHFVASGPLRLFGAGLLPAGWAALIGAGADHLANRVSDLGDIAGPLAAATLTRMGESRGLADLVAAADAFFLGLARQAQSPPLSFTRIADQWLAAAHNPDVNQLLAATGLSARQVERLTLRVYGASPKLLARKYRALQAAVRFGLAPDKGWMHAAGDAFYDQSHFIREFKTFIGMTPGQFLAENTDRLNQLTIVGRQQAAAMPVLNRVS